MRRELARTPVAPSLPVSAPHARLDDGTFARREERPLSFFVGRVHEPAAADENDEPAPARRLRELALRVLRARASQTRHARTRENARHPARRLKLDRERENAGERLQPDSHGI